MSNLFLHRQVLLNSIDPQLVKIKSFFIFHSDTYTCFCIRICFDSPPLLHQKSIASSSSVTSTPIHVQVHYEEASGDYDAATNALDAYGVLVTDDEDAIDVDATKAAIEANTNTEASVKYQMEDEETLDTYDIDVYYSEVPAGAKKDKTNAMSYLDAVEYFNKTEMAEIDPADYGVFVPSIPDLAERGLRTLGHIARFRSPTSNNRNIDAIFTGKFR